MKRVTDKFVPVLN